MSFSGAAKRPVAKIFTEAYVRELTDTYARQRKQLLKIVKSVNATEYAQFRASALLTQVKAEIAILDKAAVEWSKKRIPKSYRMGQALAEKNLRELRVTSSVDYGSVIHTESVKVLVDSVAADLVGANQSISKKMQSFIRRTQQTLIEDREISRMIADGVVSGKTRKQTSDAILRALDKQLSDGKMITINGRNYDPASYARLVARTRTREAATQGTINTCMDYDVSLVQVSAQDHLSNDEICPAYAGRIFSLTGSEQNGFPPLDRKPPFHPNCRHTLSGVTIEAVEASGAQDALVSLSNNKKVKIESFAAFKGEIA